MKKQFYISVLLFTVILCSFLNSCKTQKQLLTGSWENKEQNLSFDGNAFTLKFNESKDIQIIYGTYEFAQNPANVVKLYYKTYTDSLGATHTFEGTEMNGYVDYLMYQITGKKLTTRVLANDMFFTYSRVEK